MTQVFLVEIFKEDGSDQFGIFSSEEKADEWIESLGVIVTGACICPFVIDEPEYGNIPRSKMS